MKRLRVKYEINNNFFESVIEKIKTKNELIERGLKEKIRERIKDESELEKIWNMTKEVIKEGTDIMERENEKEKIRRDMEFIEGLKNIIEKKSGNRSRGVSKKEEEKERKEKREYERKKEDLREEIGEKTLKMVEEMIKKEGEVKINEKIINETVENYAEIEKIIDMIMRERLKVVFKCAKEEKERKKRKW